MQAIMETLFDIVYDASKPVDQCPSTFIEQLHKRRIHCLSGCGLPLH